MTPKVRSNNIRDIPNALILQSILDYWWSDEMDTLVEEYARRVILGGKPYLKVWDMSEEKKP